MINRRFVPIVLMAAALLLFTIGVANADLKPTNVIGSYDVLSTKWENGNVQMNLDGGTQPFYTVLDFDTDLHSDACGIGSPQTRWAGDTYVSFDNLNKATPPQAGFQPPTTSWSIIRCDSIVNGDPNPTSAPIETCVEAVGTAPGVACTLLTTKDAIIDVNQGAVAKTMDTKFHVTIDANCDGVVDQKFLDAGIDNNPATADNLCLYWRATKPLVTDPVWRAPSNIQVRYRADNDTSGGDKTVNFAQPAGPNAVSLSSLGAVAEANTSTLAAWGLGLVLVGAAVFVWRRNRA